MARVVKEFDERYTEFLDVAEELFQRQGYEQTSVQAIISRMGVAKGTFYHYFASKAELLDALVERMYERTLSALVPLVTDASIDAAEKLERLFTEIGRWETAHRDFLLDALHVFYQDENVLLRTKVMAQSMSFIAPLLAQIIEQGVDEGTFDVAHPAEVAEIVLTMGQACADAIVALLLQEERDPQALHSIERKLVAYDRSIERVLGAPEGSIRLIDPELLDAWLPGAA